MSNVPIDLLRQILTADYDRRNPLRDFYPYKASGHILSIKKGETILFQQDPVAYLYILLSGRTMILNQIDWTTDNIIDYVSPPHILGLVEALAGTPKYTAFVVADTDCVLFRINASDFLQIIRRNSELCYATLVLMGNVTDSNMSAAEIHRVFPSKDILGHHLYLLAKNEQPFTYPHPRRILATELNINLRTLFRYVNSMEEKDYLSVIHGKIVINEQQFIKLSKRYGNIIL